MRLGQLHTSYSRDPIRGPCDQLRNARSGLLLNDAWRAKRGEAAEFGAEFFDSIFHAKLVACFSVLRLPHGGCSTPRAGGEAAGQINCQPDGDVIV